MFWTQYDWQRTLGETRTPTYKDALQMDNRGTCVANTDTLHIEHWWGTVFVWKNVATTSGYTATC